MYLIIINIISNKYLLFKYQNIIWTISFPINISYQYNNVSSDLSVIIVSQYFIFIAGMVLIQNTFGFDTMIAQNHGSVIIPCKKKYKADIAGIPESPG